MTSISDDFNRTDNTDLGANWTEDTGAWEINTNQLIQTTATSTHFKCRWTGTALSSNNYDVEVDVESNDWTMGHGPFGRGAVSSTVTYYSFLGFGNDAFYLVETTAGSENILDSGGTCVSGTLYNLRLRCDGSNLTGYVNDVETLNGSDSTLSSGAVGVDSYGHTNGTADIIDNFAASDLGGATPSPSVSDSIALSEDKSLIVGTAQVSPSDTVTVGDSPALTVGTSLVNVSDSITATDDPTVSMEEVPETLGIAITPDNVFAVGVRIYTP